MNVLFKIALIVFGMIIFTTLSQRHKPEPLRGTWVSCRGDICEGTDPYTGKHIVQRYDQLNGKFYDKATGKYRGFKDTPK